MVYAPRRVYLALGRPGHLECYYNSNPEITKIRWEKDGFLFDAYNVPGVSARRNGSLYFSKVFSIIVSGGGGVLERIL